MCVHTAERFNRILTDNTQTRLDAMGLDRGNWASQLEPITNKYNNTEHGTIHTNPYEARKERRSLMVSFSLCSNAQRIHRYPEIKVGDEVRVMAKQDSNSNGYMPNWQTDA